MGLRMKEAMWYVYLLRCADATLYCGVTTDMERRLREHNAGSRGAKYTRRAVPLSWCAAWRSRMPLPRAVWSGR